MNTAKTHLCVIVQCEHCKNYVYSIYGNEHIVCPYCNNRTRVDYERAQVLDSLIEAVRLTQQYNQGNTDEFFKNVRPRTTITPLEREPTTLPDELTKLFLALDQIPSSHKNKKLRVVLQYLETARDVSVIKLVATAFEGNWFEKQLTKLEEDGLIHINDVLGTIRFVGDINELYPQPKSITECRKAIENLFSKQRRFRVESLVKQLEEMGYPASVIDRTIYLLRYKDQLIESKSGELVWSD